MSPTLIMLGIVLAVSWVTFAACLIWVGRRRRADPSLRFSWRSRVLVMCWLLGSFVGTAVLQLLKQGYPRERIVDVLLLHESAFETALPRYGLAAVYLIFLSGVFYPQSRIK